MPKPEDTGRGPVGKTRLLVEDTDDAPAGTLVEIVSKEQNLRRVRPVDGGALFTVEARQLRGDDEADEADDA